jgi:type II secretory pathway pseudopilin PulG
MSYRRLLGFLPDRSGVMLLAVALTAALALLGFGSLVISKAEALADQHQAREQLAQLQEQQRRLTSALEQARAEQNILPRAWELYHRLPPGLIVIVGESAGGDVGARKPGDGLPVWVQLLDQARQSLTKLRNGLQ